MIKEILKKVPINLISATVLTTVLATSAVGMEINGLSDSLKENIIYYNSFDQAGKVDVSKIKLKTLAMPKKILRDEGISGNCAVVAAQKGQILLSSIELGLHNNRTYSYWFNFESEWPKNQGGYFFSNFGKSNITQKFNFIAAFVRGGPWCSLKDSAFVTQMWDFNKIKGISKIINKKFRESYPAKKWHYFAITSNGKEISVYLDGKLQSLINAPRVLDDKDNLNQVFMTKNCPVNIKIDELMIFDLPLSKEQIQEYYQATSAILARKEME